MAGKQGSFVWKGVAVVETVANGESTGPDAHEIRVEVGDEVVYRMRGEGGGARDEVRDAHPAVKRHYHQLEAKRQVTAYRNRSVRCELPPGGKAPKVVTVDAPRDEIGRPMERCPACAGVGATMCGYCDQLGWVTIGQAENWRDAHDTTS
jgi:hypothetical protein